MLTYFHPAVSFSLLIKLHLFFILLTVSPILLFGFEEALELILEIEFELILEIGRDLVLGACLELAGEIGFDFEPSLILVIIPP